MKLEIEVKYNIGDRVYYIYYDGTVRAGEITNINFSNSKDITYTIDNSDDFTEDKLFLSIRECEESRPDYLYNIQDKVYVIYEDMMIKGLVYSRYVIDGKKLYTIQSSNENYSPNIEESNIFATLEEALKHF